MFFDMEDDFAYLLEELIFDSDSESEETLERKAIERFRFRYSTSKAIEDEKQLIGTHGWNLLNDFANSVDSNNYLLDFPEEFDIQYQPQVEETPVEPLTESMSQLQMQNPVQPNEEINQSTKNLNDPSKEGYTTDLSICQTLSKCLKLIHPYFDSVRNSCSLLRDKFRDKSSYLTRFVKRAGAGSLVLELNQTLNSTELQKLRQEIEDYVKQDDDGKRDIYQVNVVTEYVEKVQSCFIYFQKVTW